MGRQGRFDLAKLNAVASNLDLVIGPAEELKLGRPVDHSPSAKVTAAIQQSGGASGQCIRAGYKPLRGEVRSPEVPVGHARTADVYLADHAGRHRSTVPIQQVDLGVCRGLTDGDGRPPIGSGVKAVDHAADNGFRRTVFVVHRQVRVLVLNRPRQIGGQIFATDDRNFEVVGNKTELTNDRQVGRREFYDVGPIVPPHRNNRRRPVFDVVRVRDDRATRRQRNKDGGDGQVKGKRGEQRKTPSLTVCVLPSSPADVVAQTPVVYRYTLWFSGRTRGEDCIGGGIQRPRPWRTLPLGGVGPKRTGTVKQHGCCAGLFCANPPGDVGTDEPGTGVLDHLN